MTTLFALGFTRKTSQTSADEIERAAVARAEKEHADAVRLKAEAHELSEPISSGSLYDYQCDLSRTARAADLARAGPESPGLCYAETSVCDIESGGSGFTASRVRKRPITATPNKVR